MYTLSSSVFCTIPDDFQPSTYLFFVGPAAEVQSGGPLPRLPVGWLLPPHSWCPPLPVPRGSSPQSGDERRQWHPRPPPVSVVPHEASYALIDVCDVWRQSVYILNCGKRWWKEGKLPSWNPPTTWQMRHSSLLCFVWIHLNIFSYAFIWDDIIHCSIVAFQKHETLWLLSPHIRAKFIYSWPKMNDMFDFEKITRKTWRHHASPPHHPTL